MNLIRYASILSVLLIMPIEANAINQKQQHIYAQDPHLVKEAGNMNDPKIREEFISAMKRASGFSHKAAWGCGIAAIGCLGALVYAQSGAAKVGSAGLSLFLAVAASFLNQVSAMQACMAHDQELVETEVSPDAVSTSTKLIDVADGIYIFSSEYCPPCKLLHEALPKMRDSLPALDIFEYTIDVSDAEAEMIIKRMDISVRSVPLTVLVKNQVIVGIIVGYGSSKDFVQKINESLEIAS